MIDPKCPMCGALLTAKKQYRNEDKCWKCNTENISELINSQIECSECGVLNLPSKSFCSKCNKPLYGISSEIYDMESKKSELNICIDCNIQNSKDAKFCKSCGKKLFKEKEITIIKCNKCGKEYNDTFQYCEIDGEKLESETTIVDISDSTNNKESLKDNDINTKVSKWIAKTPTTFGFGNFYIAIGFLQSTIAFIFSFIGGVKTEYLPNRFFGLIASIYCFTLAYGLYQRKLYGLFLVVTNLIILFIYGLIIIIENFNSSEMVIGFIYIVVFCLVSIYWYKRRNMFSR